MSGIAETARDLSDILAVDGDVVAVLRDGAEAFRRVWDDDFDVIVSELGVPGADGRAHGFRDADLAPAVAGSAGCG